MGLLQRLKRTIRGPESSTVSYSIEVLRCDECGEAFESRTAPANARCPECDAADIQSLHAAGDGRSGT